MQYRAMGVRIAVGWAGLKCGPKISHYDISLHPKSYRVAIQGIVG